MFLEFVRRNPGKGCWKTFPSFKVNVSYDSFEGYEQSWTERELFAYREDLWVAGSTFMHIEAPCASDTDYEILPAAETASMLLTYNVPLGVEDLIWLKKLAVTRPQPSPPSAPSIAWNRELGELTIDGQLARRIARPKQAKNVTKILEAFQEDGWPVRIDSPFEADEAGRTRLRETGSQLNVQLTGIKFEADGTGEGVRYRLIPVQQTADVQSSADDTLAI